jgi:hypothetical protein
MNVRKRVLLSIVGFLAAAGLPLSAAFADSPTLSIQSLSPGSTVQVGNEITFTLVPASFSGTVSYTVSDSMTGSSVTSNDVNSSGVFVWIPTQADAGQHTITVTASDGTNSATASQSLTIIGTPAVSIQSLSASTTAPGTPITFTAVATSFQANPVYTVSDSANSSTLVSSDINSSGQFSWTPGNTDIGQHNITLRVTDSDGESATMMFTLYVQGAGSLNISSPSPGTSVPAGTSVSFTAIPASFTPISYTASDSFASSSITNNNISQSGYFVWTPTQYDVGSHTITITAGEYGSSQTFATSTMLTVTPSSYIAPTTIPVYTQTTTTPSPSLPTYVFSVYLKPGSQGADVTELQRVLIKDGYLSASATGYYGSLTEVAVEQYQAAHGIDQLGVVGPSTRAALNTEESSSTSGSSSANAALIAILLQELQVLEAKIAALQATQH